MPLIVVDRVVLRAAVVPQRDRPRTPAEAAGEVRADLMAEEILEQRRALLLRHAVEGDRVRRIDVECLAARLRMHADGGMCGDVLLLRVDARAVLDPVLAGARDVRR